MPLTVTCTLAVFAISLITLGWNGFPGILASLLAAVFVFSVGSVIVLLSRASKMQKEIEVLRERLDRLSNKISTEDGGTVE